MGSVIAIAIVSFMLGALVAGSVALGVIAILYREAADMVDSYMSAATSPAFAGRAGHQDWRPRIVGSDHGDA